MSVPRRGSRRIEVDGVAYLWRVRRRPTADQRTGRTPLLLAIAAEQGGPALIVRLHRAHPGNEVGRHSQAVTPGEVAAYVRAGCHARWQPLGPGRSLIVGARELAADAPRGPRTWPRGQRPPTREQLAALARAGRRDRFHLVDGTGRVTWPEGGCFSPCEIEINGVDLVALVRAAERPHAEREIARRRAAGEEVDILVDELAGAYLGLPASSMRLPSRALLDAPIDLTMGFVLAPDDPRRGKATLLGCSCGIFECWFLQARITLLDDVVIWSEFEQFHRDWVYELGPFIFDRAEYEAALAAPGR